ncbi:bacteriohopanetetrol glucosamine biosynthesis glycosyltransferase HpnI [Tolypothrix sp. FACHB-123]|nr:bacteriohopanetetrol glucosamine biosynthesis glycosyltransferase HpnI [Tolypothrix sp. FACHB-123]MBD2354682.1 bacteriohopanetetrol glucosamine biosynthesis glycosyltransferase HpnI [Tolypothrix sp. FACHB-123]
MLLIKWLLLILCLAAICFYCYSIYAAIAFFTQTRTIDPAFLPQVTILKPICGVDRDAEDNLASCCQQDYPEYQIIFAVRDREDPAIAIIDKLIQQFPNVDIQLVVSDRIIGANLKVSNLANALTAAKYEILLIADSDIRVGKDYLQRIVQPLQDEKVGVVTCLYRSLAQGWVTSFEALGIATSFHPSVLVSNQLENIKFAFGSTIIIRKQALEAIGGFNAIADYLADDFQLGYLPAQVGYRVFLSNYIVDHILDESTLADVIQRQIRWLRCIWVSRPWGYLGLVFTYGTVTSLLLLLVTKGSIIGWTGLVITWVLRLIMAWVIGVRVFNDPVTKQYFWLIPFRDLIHFAIWCYGFFGKAITWRGQQLQLIQGGKLVLQENMD